MCVRQDKQRGFWFVDTTWPDGMRTREKMPDLKTAHKLNKKIEVACADENRIWQKLRRELRLEGGILQGFSQFSDLYFQKWVLSHNDDLRTKKSRLKILKTYFGSLPIDAITVQHVDGFITERLDEEGVSKRTVNRDLSVLNHIYQWAVSRSYIEFNPISKVERLEEVDFVGQRPNDQIIREVFAKLHPASVPVFTFIRDTGCRCGEAISLRRSQLDFASATVVFHTNTKNKRSRQVPLTEAAICAISSMPRRGERVFYNPADMVNWTGDSIALVWERARASAGHNWLRIHDLRHAYGIRLAEQGCPMHFISEVLGHYSVDFTRRIYARFSPESASKAVLKVLEGGKAAAGSENR